MDDWHAYKYDVNRRLQDAIDELIKAQRDLHNGEPPWPDLDQRISVSLAALHVARVHLTAARVAHAKAVHAATVAKNRADDEDLAGEQS